MIKLTVIIILYNEFESVVECLKSVYKENYKNIEIILVDNSSDKKGHEKVLLKFPKIRYLQNSEDLGFGRAVNIGIQHSQGAFAVVLTPDMYLLPGTIRQTISYMEKNQRVGMLGCRIFSSPKNQEFSAVSCYPSLLTQLYYYNIPFYKFLRRIIKNYQPLYLSKINHEDMQQVKAVSGQYMLMRKSAISQVDYFDNRFFLYFEDIDICKRLNEHGWKVIYLPVGGMVQNGISGWKKKVRITQALPPYMQSLYLFFDKHYGRTYAVAAWFVGAFSALMSVPYLFFVSRIKKIFHLSSQASYLLPLWIGIVKWHFTEGLKMVFR